MAPRVVIIGGGIIGCGIAHELARRGCGVDLLADRALGQGATQASAGMLVPYVEVHARGPMLDLSARSLAIFDEFVARVRSDAGADYPFEYSRNGSLQVAFREEEAATLERAAMLLGANRVSCDWLGADELRRAEPALAEGATGGLIIHDHGVVAAEALLEALWQAASACGARFLPARVTSLKPRGSAWSVETSAGDFSAEAVVLAAGAWAGSIPIEGAPRAPVTPIRGQLLYLQWPGAPLARVTWGPRCYLVPWRDGTLLVGATLERVGFDKRNTVAGVHDLLDAASELIPQVCQAGFTGARAGLRPGTPDDLPVIGRSSAPGLFYAAGHYRNGVLLTPITAKLTADLIVDGIEDDLLRHFSPDRFGGAHG